MVEHDQLLDWMEHSLQLADDRLAKERKIAKQHPDRAQVKRWTTQANCERAVVDAVRSGEVDDLEPHLKVWHEYMIGHATLQIERYAGQITTDEFYAQCRDLREQHTEQL